MPGGAARGEIDSFDFRPIRSQRFDLGKSHIALLLANAPQHRIDQGLRLFIDLLAQEMLETAFLRGHRIPADVGGFALDRSPVKGCDSNTLTRDFCHLAIFEVKHAPCMLEDRRHVGGNKILALAQPDNNWRCGLCGQQATAIIVGKDHDRKGAFEFAHSRPSGLHELHSLIHMMVDQLRDDFGVGLRMEGPATLLESLLQLQKVLDDPVVDDHNLARTVRVGILLAGRPVGSPARVADPDVPGKRLLGQGVFEIGQFAHRATHIDAAAAVEGGHAGRVVAAIFQLPQAVYQDAAGILITDITHDTAHEPGILLSERIYALQRAKESC